MTIANAKPDLLITGPIGTTTVNAASSAWHDYLTVEAKITAAIAYAVSIGAKYCYVPDSFLPYTASLVTFNPAVMMLCEGGDPTKYDIRAYGAACDGTTDDTASGVAVITAAKGGSASTANTGGVIQFPAGKVCKMTVFDLSGVRGITVQGQGHHVRDNSPYPPMSTLLITGNGGGAVSTKTNGGIRLFGGAGVATEFITFRDINLEYDTATLDALINISSANADTSGPSYLTFERCGFSGRVAGTATKCFWFGGVINWVNILNCHWNINWQQEIVQRYGPIGTPTSAFNGVAIRDCVFYANLTLGLAHIDIQQCQFLDISHNDFEFTGSAIKGTNSEGSPANLFNGVRIEDNWMGDISGATTGATCIDIYALPGSICRNIIYQGGTNNSGINVRGGGSTVIENNLVQFFTGTGITCWADNSRVAHNTVLGSATAVTLIAINGNDIVCGPNSYQGTFTNSLAWNAGNRGTLIPPIPATGVSGLGGVTIITQPAATADRGDASITVVAGVDAPTILYNTPLTVARTVTFSVAATPPRGAKFRTVRTAAATGAFNLTVGAKVLAAAGNWVEHEYVAGAWTETASGAL